MAPRLSVIIPTQRRPGPLSLAAHSVLGQRGVDLADIELIVADNDRLPTAQPIARALAAKAPFKVVYVHEPAPGVANVRNAAMAAATGEMIAFLDDDEEAPPGWLAALTGALARYEADVVFGPVRGRAPASLTRHRAYLERFFSREGPQRPGRIDDYYGCGNSLLRRAALSERGGADPAAPFAKIRNHIGGEDDLLFGAMKAAGARFAWAPDAWVWEDPAPERLSLTYALRRAFAYGQGAPSASAAASPPRWGGVAKWMLVGAAQAAAYGALAAAQWAAGSDGRAQTLDRAARGLGKLCWFGPFKIRFYGLAPAQEAQAMGARALGARP